MDPGEGEVVEAGEAGFVDDGAGHGGEAGHSGERGSEEGERDGAASVVLAGIGGGDVRDDAADRWEISDG